MDGVYKALENAGEWPQNRFYGISNQGGVAANHKRLTDCFEEMFYTLKLVPALEAIAFCPDYEGQKLWVAHSRNLYTWHEVSNFYPDLIGTYRKPGAGMLNFAMWSCGFEPSEAVMIGDSSEDEEAAVAAGVSFLSADSWRSGVKFLPGGSIVV
jgi:histidinol phosphatase-like enzyme